ncbi:MAG: CRISPR-associated endoribonuclease Cas6 [bacterium]|nr:CRISPR-associated endoribonuclease Cas6 [bacterium]
MRIKIELLSEKPVILPVGFNEYIQAVIYTHLDSLDGNWLHEKGFSFEKRNFKLFAFSSIQERGNFNSADKTLTFRGRVSFYVSSPVEWILKQLAGNIIAAESVFLGKNRLSVSSVVITKQPKISTESIKVRALSPIEVHSTVTRENGKKLTHYYTPFENDFRSLVNENLKKKWKAFHEEEVPGDILITPLYNGNRNEKILYFGTRGKKTLVKGWSGFYRLEGAPGLLEFALDAGLGSRNSQGFGMVEEV